MGVGRDPTSTKHQATINWLNYFLGCEAVYCLAQRPSNNFNSRPCVEVPIVPYMFLLSGTSERRRHNSAQQTVQSSSKKSASVWNLVERREKASSCLRAVTSFCFIFLQSSKKHSNLPDSDKNWIGYHLSDFTFESIEFVESDLLK